MIYLEYDDGHNQARISDYVDRADAVRCILGSRPTMEEGRKHGLGPYRDRLDWSGRPVTAAELLTEDQRQYDYELKQLESLLCDPDDPRAEWSVMINCDTYNRVDAREMERRAEHAKMCSVAMRKGIRTP